MAFGGSTSRFGAAMMPALAILRHELGSLWSGWLVRLWLIGSGLIGLLTLAGGWGTEQTAILIARLLFPFLVLPWFVVVMILGISPVSGTRLDALADGILSRPITRYEYLVASWAARVITVLGVFLVVSVPCVLIVPFAERNVIEDSVTVYGTLSTLFLVGLVLACLVSLGFLAGTLLRRPMVAAVLLVLVYFPAIFILHNFELEQFSPVSLDQALPTLLRTPWRTSGAEPKVQLGLEMGSLARLLTDPFGRPMRAGGNDGSRDFFKSGDYRDFSLWKVILGYTLPTLAALGLATLCFCRRDL